MWHPYGPMPGRTEPLVVESASGVRLRLEDRREAECDVLVTSDGVYSALRAALDAQRAATPAPANAN